MKLHNNQYFFALPERMLGCIALYVTISAPSRAEAIQKFRFVCGGPYAALFDSLDALRADYLAHGYTSAIRFGSY